MPGVVLYYLGFGLICCLGVLVWVAIVFAVPGHIPDDHASKVMAGLVTFLIYATPVWEMICLKAYSEDWISAWPRFVWIPLTLVPVLILVAAFQIVERMQ